MGNAKSVKLFLLILFGLIGVVHGSTGIYFRAVFEKSTNAIFNQDKEVDRQIGFFDDEKSSR